MISGTISAVGRLSGVLRGASLSGMLQGIGSITGNLAAQASMDGNLDPVGGLSGILSQPRGSVPEYRGDYTYTPSNAEQVVQINGKMATSNITINPIPSNYGLIAWNGAALSVS